jgi:AcrR family transcriptional regulator
MKGASGRAPTRRERERAAHRREMIEAAERVFARKGFDRATVADIAREAEFSVGALYTFFENKDVLWGQVVAKIGSDFMEAYRRETAAVGGPLEAISALILLRLRHAREHSAFIRVFMETRPGSRLAPADALPRSCHGLYDAYIAAAASLFKAAMTKGLLRKADPTYTALALEGVISAFGSYWRRRDNAPPVSEQARLVHRYFLAPLAIRRGEK